MNFSGALSHLHICESCHGECFAEQMSEDHTGLCIECGKSLQAELDAECVEELLSDEEIAEAFLAESEAAE